jgi:hypothetical protein
MVGVGICRLQPVRILEFKHELDKGRGNLTSQLGYNDGTLYSDTTRTWHRQHRIHHRIVLMEGFAIELQSTAYGVK